MLQKLFNFLIFLILLWILTIYSVENWFHHNVCSAQFVDDLLLYEIDEVEIKVFGLYTNGWKGLVKIIKWEAEDLVVIQ